MSRQPEAAPAPAAPLDLRAFIVEKLGFARDWSHYRYEIRCSDGLHQVGSGIDAERLIRDFVQSQLARLTAELAEVKAKRDHLEQKYRFSLWLNHGHSLVALYGDDGEMQCSRCHPFGDYKRDPLDKIEAMALKAKSEAREQALGKQ